MNKKEFISGCHFKIGRSETYVFEGTANPCEYFSGVLSEVNWRSELSHHCNVSKITNRGISVYKTLAGKSISRFVPFSDMVKV